MMISSSTIYVYDVLIGTLWNAIHGSSLGFPIRITSNETNLWFPVDRSFITVMRIGSSPLKEDPWAGFITSQDSWFSMDMLSRSNL